MLRTPSRTLTITKGIPASITHRMGPTWEKPKTSPRNRAQTRAGMARMAITQSWKKASTALEMPMATPRIDPITTAIRKPMVSRAIDMANWT